VKFVVGVVTLVALTVSSTLVAVAVTAPAFYAHPMTNYTFPLPSWLGGATYVVDTLPEALVLAVLGVIGMFLTVNALNALAWALGRATELACRYARVLGPVTATPEHA
jgi:hypothetical protein